MKVLDFILNINQKLMQGFVTRKVIFALRCSTNASGLILNSLYEYCGLFSFQNFSTFTLYKSFYRAEDRRKFIDKNIST